MLTSKFLRLMLRPQHNRPRHVHQARQIKVGELCF